MAAEEIVHLRDVEVLRKTDWALWCRIGAIEIAVPNAVVRAPQPLPLAGERVTLTVPKWFAVDHGLV